MLREPLDALGGRLGALNAPMDSLRLAPGHVLHRPIPGLVRGPQTVRVEHPQIVQDTPARSRTEPRTVAGSHPFLCAGPVARSGAGAQKLGWTVACTKNQDDK